MKWYLARPFFHQKNVSENLRRNVLSVEASQSIMFAHKILYLYLSMEPNKQGNENCKMNNSIILNVNYITLNKRVISDFMKINAREVTSPILYGKH